MKWSEYYKEVLHLMKTHSLSVFTGDVERLTKRCLELEECLILITLGKFKTENPIVDEVIFRKVLTPIHEIAKEALEKEIDE